MRTFEVVGQHGSHRWEHVVFDRLIFGLLCHAPGGSLGRPMHVCTSHVCMHVCTSHVCIPGGSLGRPMHVCTSHVCMHVCTNDVCIPGGSLGGPECIHACLYACMACIHACHTPACVYTCMPYAMLLAGLTFVWRRGPGCAALSPRPCVPK